MTAPVPSSQQHEPTFIGVHHVHSEIPRGTGGLLCADRVRAQDVAAVVADLCAGRALRTTVRPDFEQAPLWTAAARAAGTQELPITHHVLDLDRNFDQL
jgi:hypothetical protein